MTSFGSAYLLPLSALAVSFVGFSGVIVALRRALAVGFVPIHTYLIRFFIEGGLAVAAFGLLPAALSFTELSAPTIWRAVSATAAMLFLGWLILLVRRRQTSVHIRLPLQGFVDIAVFLVSITGFALNVIGFPFEPAAGLYVLALSCVLVAIGMVFIQNLELFFSRPHSQSTSQSADEPQRVAR